MNAIRRALANMPPGWAKRRLIEGGPAMPGTVEAKMAVLVLAAELKRWEVTEEDTIAYMTSRLPMFETGNTRGRALLKQLDRSVRAAYNPPRGEGALSGCPRDPRPRSGSAGAAAMRATFEPYCDEECERVCPMLRGIKNPDRSLYATPYEPLLRSSVWLHGAGLGHAGLISWRLAALLALAQGTEEVKVSGNYVALKSEGAVSPQHARRVLLRMHQLGIVTLLHKRSGLRTIHVRSPEWVADLERQEGMHGLRERNVAEARKSSDEYLGWLSNVSALDEWNPDA